MASCAHPQPVQTHPQQHAVTWTPAARPAPRPAGAGSTAATAAGQRRRRRACSAAAAAKSSAATQRASTTGAPSKAKPAAAGTQPAADAAAVSAAVEESLQLLEWPALCRQVACFAQTPMGAEVAMRCALPVGRSQAESELLLRETAEAQQAQLEFRGVYDVRQAAAAAEQGRALHPMVLGAVAQTLTAAARLQAQLQRQGGAGLPALADLAAGIGDALAQLREAIEGCIQPEEGRILDSASPALGEVRAARRANRAELRAGMDRWARQLQQQGVSERAQVVVRRERLCIPVRRGRQGELPKGSVTLAASESGNTLYVEPQPLVQLNNAEMALAGREQEEETAVLVALSGMVAQQAQQLRGVLGSITALDVASARGRHATWLGAATPPRFLSEQEAAAGGPVQLPHAWHPLLLQPSLAPLPAPPLPEDAQQRLQADALSGSLEGLELVPELAAAASPSPIGDVGSSLPKSSSSAGNGAASSGARRATPPRPVDLTVPPGVSVVAVTGPNTGGKTASLKTLGLQCLMAKAGLFLPQAPAEQSGGPGPAPQAPQALRWFDRVLADLGDGQSLQQSLSTFSGHVRRIRHVLAAATPQSLVLLDEVGSGTDPAEGAALAAALLERLQRRAALTYATTHHAELKELALTAPGFVNASVEFDVASLAPTYRLVWGAAGESNALAVAQGLGFAGDVVAAAREVAEQLRHSAGSTAEQRTRMLQASLEEQLGEARRAAEESAASRAAAEAAAAAAQQQLEAVQQQRAELARAEKQQKSAGGEVQQRAQKLLADARAGRQTVQQVEEALRAMQREAAAPEGAAMRLMGLQAAKASGADLDSDTAGLEEAAAASIAAPQDWVPAEGETVRVLKMGGAAGTVVSPPNRSGGKVGVRVGAVTVQLKLSDLAPYAAGAAAGQQARRGRSSSAADGGLGAGKEVRARGALGSGGSGSSGGSGGGITVAIQTSTNTVDVRGMRADDAASEVRDAVAAAGSGLALFVIHGVGTGRVRAEVLSQLKRNPRVAHFEEQEGSNGGCTIVYLK